MANVTTPDHPLLRHKLTLLRDRTTSTAQFRQVAREISLLMAYEVMRDPNQLTGNKKCKLTIKHPGNGILDGMLDLVPSARVGHIGLYRDPVSLMPVEYYLKLPSDIAERLVILVDPMLATGHSAVAAAARLKQAGVGAMKFVCLLAAPEGIATFTQAHPDVAVFAAAIDRQLDDHGYIRPGLGDAGDRFYGTR
ncbi:MAG: uracil phosphoribosyltransferase [Acetobacteraceae bacterium]